MPADLTISTRDVRRMERDLKTFAARAYPFATRQAVNGGAFEARRQWQGLIGERLVERNQWTRRSIQVEQTRTLNVDMQEATVGSRADYMRDQEFGATKRGRGRSYPIRTGAAAGQPGARPPTRITRRPNRMANITLTRDRGQYASDAQEIFVRILMAARNGERFIYLDTGERRAIYAIRGRPRVRGGRMTGVRLTMMQDLSNDSVRIPATPTLAPALERTRPRMPGIFARALRHQLQRHRVFGYR